MLLSKQNVCRRWVTVYIKISLRISPQLSLNSLIWSECNIRYLYRCEILFHWSEDGRILRCCSVWQTFCDFSEPLVAYIIRPDDRGSMHLRNVCKLLQNYEAQQRRRLISTLSALRTWNISQKVRNSLTNWVTESKQTTKMLVYDNHGRRELSGRNVIYIKY